MNKIDTELPGGDLQTVVILLFVWEQEGDARVRGRHLVMRNCGLFYAPLRSNLAESRKRLQLFWPRDNSFQTCSILDGISSPISLSLQTYSDRRLTWLRVFMLWVSERLDVYGGEGVSDILWDRWETVRLRTGVGPYPRRRGPTPFRFYSCSGMVSHPRNL